MKQLRIGMWETNSSTQHQLGLYMDYPVVIPNLAGTTMEIHSVKNRWCDGAYVCYISDIDLDLTTLESRIQALILVVAAQADYGNFFKAQNWMVLALNHIRESTGVNLVVDWASFREVSSMEFSIMNAIFETVYPCPDEESNEPTFDPDALDHYLFTDKHHHATWCDNCESRPDDFIEMDTLPEAERFRTWFDRV